MEELRDIQGLDQISAWPLAIGWWILLSVFLLATIAAAVYAWRRYKYRRSWQYRCYENLNDIEAQITQPEESSSDYYKRLLHLLAIEIRRIAMQSSARETCASLVGKQWLAWLQKNDPGEFAWNQNGQVLIEYQYMPQLVDLDTNNIKAIITASKQWVEKC